MERREFHSLPFDEFYRRRDLDLFYSDSKKDEKTFGGTRQKILSVWGVDTTYAILITWPYFVDCLGHPEEGSDPAVCCIAPEGVHIADVALDLAKHHPEIYKQLFA